MDYSPDSYLDRRTRVSFFLKITCFLIAVFLLRPSALGSNYTTLGIGMMVFVLFWHILDCKNRGLKLEVNKQNTIVMLSVLILFSYLVLQGSLMPFSVHIDFVLKSYFTHLIIIVLGAFILSDKTTNRTFFRWFTMIQLVFVVSYLVTTFLSMFIPINQLFLFKLNYGYNGAAGSTYFPFTILYGQLTFADSHITLYRLSGLFREAGIMQMFLIWSLFNLKAIGMNKIWIKLLLIVGVIVTFSTAGIILLGVNLVAQLLLKRKVILGAMLSIAAYFAAMYAPYIGMIDKADSYHAESITDRQGSMRAAWEYLSQHPMGSGFYNSTVENSGINLFGAASMIGIIGFLMCVFVFLIPLISVESKRTYILSILPVFLTSLLSQPLLDAPLIYLLLMAQYQVNKQPNIIKVVPEEAETPKINLSRLTRQPNVLN